MNVYKFSYAVECVSFAQIEDLSQQAQMVAAENFKRPENAGVSDLPGSSVSQPIQEESEEEDEVINTDGDLLEI